MRILIYILCGFLSATAIAASTYKQALDKKLNAYLDDGLIVGGRSGRGFSLLSVRRDLSPKLQMERVILDIGDIEGKPHRGRVNYFQASVDKNPPRVVVDLAQLSSSVVTEAKLKQIFAKSPYVKSVQLTADPEDRSATLVLNLRQPMALEAFEMAAGDKPSRIVLDLKKVDLKNKKVR